jgi:hypothetical protein
MTIKRTESMIQKAIMDYLEMISKQIPLYFFRAGSGAVQTMHGRFFKTGRPGVPDIILCWAGKFVGLEVKAESGRQSQAQKKAEQDIAQANGQYYIVRSVSDVKEIIHG